MLKISCIGPMNSEERPIYDSPDRRRRGGLRRSHRRPEGSRAPARLIALFAAIVGLIPASTGITSEPDPQKLIDSAEDMVKGETARGTIEMTVTRPDFTRSMRMKSWWEGNEKALIVIEAPRKDAGNKTLKIGNEMWNYLENTETTIKVPPSMMLQSWNGSDFTNDDLVRESNYAEDYDASVEGTGEAEGEPYWDLLLRPKPEAPVVWGKLIYRISKADTLPVRLEYYDEQGTLKRHLVFSDRDTVGSRVIPTTWTMYDDTKDGHRTTMEILEMEFDIEIGDRIFSKRELESGR